TPDYTFTLFPYTTLFRSIGIEAVEEMVARGRENAAANGLQNVTFMGADLSKLSINQLMQRCGRVDAVLLDPPRDGAREVVANLGDRKSTRLNSSHVKSSY